jgi:hypothetical protein
MLRRSSWLEMPAVSGWYTASGASAAALMPAR